MTTTSITRNDSAPASEKPTPNVGPGDLKPEGNNPFLLSKPEMVAVQTYVEAALQLPTTENAFRSVLQMDDQGDVQQFTDIINVYQSINLHCAHFKTVTYPMTVSLASDIVHYNLKVPVYYGALTDVLKSWEAGKLSDDMAQKKLVAIATNLQQAAEGYAKNAQTARNEIARFAVETASDKTALTPVQKKYDDKYNQQGGVIETFQNKIASLQAEIEQLNNEYNHNVIVASTTPTYAWVLPGLPIGIIAAVVVAGVYGKKATDTLDRIHAAQEELANEQNDLQEAVRLMSYLTIADQSVDKIMEQLNEALPVIQKMQGVWEAIASDMNNIVRIIASDITQAPLIIADLGIPQAIDAWAAVAKIADAYRANAFITIVPAKEAEQDSQKLGLPEQAQKIAAAVAQAQKTAAAVAQAQPPVLRATKGVV